MALKSVAYFRKEETRRTVLFSLAGITVILLAFIIFRFISRELDRRRRLREEEILRRQQAEREKALLSGEADGEPWAEKANQLRLYSGAKYTLTEAIGPGQVCAVTGLTHAKPGTGLGAERDSDVPVLEPVLSYQVLLPEGAPVLTIGASLI